jgi:putative ABC transport system permease protein
MVLRLIYESFRFAWEALRANVFRTILSLLGVSIGIFAIVAVFTLVDSMERNIRQSLDFLGSNVVYINKWPWFPDTENGEYNWWDFFRRPNIQYQHFKYLEENLEDKAAICAMDFEGNVTVKRNNNAYKALMQGVTFEYNKISDVPLAEGRYFSPIETESGRNVAIIGDEVRETLFDGTDPIGQEIKIKGIKFLVIGVQEKKGKSVVNFGGDADKKVLLTYGSFAKLFQGGNPAIDVVVKALDGDRGAEQLESAIKGVLRPKRGLKPTQSDDFAVNHPEAASKILDNVFNVLGLAGAIIGGFSLLIGGFGIANIMFVSVKERTNIIGIQKSLGAKNYFILFQFLFEAVFLSLLGGMIGIALAYFITFLPLDSFEIILSWANIVKGFTIASIIGLVSGLIPAWVAARLDPVIAIRAK